ncbi:MAG: hypothetical protein KME10_28005 [Plectolyngbya sp. WJT66-NPBG17]|jgi:hypothetical protein|nr:hypothetical protein [Plectolyngbya sp. WJT66-NPBG17]
MDEQAIINLMNESRQALMASIQSLENQSSYGISALETSRLESLETAKKALIELEETYQQVLETMGKEQTNKLKQL